MGTIRRGYKYELAPTPDQDEAFARFAGVCRLVYNLGLEQRRDHWRAFKRHAGRSISYVSQARELTQLRAEHDWIAAVSQTCQQQALRDLDAAYRRWFKGLSGPPRARKKGVNDSFRFQGREVSTRRLNTRWSAVRLPKIGWVRYRDTRPLAGEIRNVTVSRDAQGWQVAFSLEIPWTRPVNGRPDVGIDMGVARTITLSTGESHIMPVRIRELERRHRQLQRTAARRRRGSRRYADAVRRATRLKARIARIRRDWLHRRSTDIARRFGSVALEDLRIANMTRSARGTIEMPGRNVRAKAALNRSILEQGWYSFRLMLEYKMETVGGEIAVVDPRNTSRTCSACGAIDARSRKNQADFTCTTCGATFHADENAAVNILRRNAASMRVEGTGYRPGEARTGEGLSEHCFLC